MVGRTEQIELLKEALNSKKSSFIAVTGRRRVGKTYLIDEVYRKNMCIRITGIQKANLGDQMRNFVRKIEEYSGIPFIGRPMNWSQAFQILKFYLSQQSNRKKQVIFLDELPWMVTKKSNFVQLLAHLWNDYLSKESHFILVICGSANSWINKNIVNDKGGLHNRLTHHITIRPFNLKETKQFLKQKGINWSDQAIADTFMVLGGIPFYLDKIKRGESPAQCIDRILFNQSGVLRNEYDNLFKAIFSNPENHEKIIRCLASSHHGLTREELLQKSGLEAGGPYTRAMSDLLLTEFVSEEIHWGRKKKGSVYKLIDEYSLFYHKFMRSNKNSGSGIWIPLSQSQSYKSWRGFAFENLVKRHIPQIKSALKIGGVYSQTSSLREVIDKKVLEIDLLIDRMDQVINLCECKYLNKEINIDKKFCYDLAMKMLYFQQYSKTRKSIQSCLIVNQLNNNKTDLSSSIDVIIELEELFK